MARHHVVMLPFMAQGHIIPFLALAKLLEQRNPRYTITLVNTPLNIQSLQSLLPPNSNIQLRDLPFCSSDHGLSPNFENSDSLPRHHIIRLLHASETLQPHFQHLITNITNQDGLPPLCIISDVFFGWTVGIAKKFNIFHTTFTTCGGYGTAAYMSLWLHLPHNLTDASEFNVPSFPETFKLHRSQLSYYIRAADGTDPWSVFYRRQIKLTLGSDAILCNTVEKVESVGVQLLQKFTGLRVWSVGPLLPLDAKSTYPRAGKKPGIELKACMEWLDSHALASVIYVSFGSQNTISVSQMMALALELEASCKPFIWVIRPPFGFDLNEEFRDEWLPEGFEARMREKEQGLLVRRWAPQLEILSHKSTGAFLSHCGWNSVLESLSRAVPIIAWPLAAEQFFNSKLLQEDLEAGVELARGIDGNFGFQDVVKVIGTVMASDKGKEMKQKAIQYSGMMRDAMTEGGVVKGSSLKALDDILEIALSTNKMRTTDSIKLED